MRVTAAFALLALGCSSTVSPVPSDDAAVVGADVVRTTDAPAPQDVVRADTVLPPTDVVEPATPCAPENDGRACASPGEGCGSGSTSCGGTTSSCACGPDRRWRCTVAMQPPCDGGVVPPPDAGACSVVGVWAIRFMEVTVYFSFDLGSWRAAGTLDGLANPIARGSWAMRGDTVELREDGGGMSTGCAPSDLGVYRPVFADACDTLRLALVSEQCPERGQGLLSWTFTRR